MTDHVIRKTIIVLTAVAGFFILVDAPALLRVPAVVLFAFVAPGLAITSFVPNLSPTERVSIAASSSLSVITIVSVALVWLNAWSGGTTFVLVAVLTLAALRSVPRSKVSLAMSFDSTGPEEPELGANSVRAQVLHISVSGALVTGPILRTVSKGVRVPFVLDGEYGVAEVRRTRNASTGDSAFYDIVFVESNRGAQRQDSFARPTWRAPGETPGRHQLLSACVSRARSCSLCVWWPRFAWSCTAIR